MKSSFWVLGSVTLLCLGVVRCSRDFLDNDENFLDKKRDEERTLKDENTEWALYKARSSWNELPKDINEQFSSLQRSDDKCEDVTCEERQKCNKDTGTCVCEDDYTGENCATLSQTLCSEKIPECASTQGTCKIKNGKIECTCSDGKTFVESQGCLSPAEMRCLNFICYNGGTCNGEKDKAECNCVDGYTGDNCEILPESVCKEKLKICADTKGTCKTADDQGKIECACSEENEFVEGKGCLSPAEVRCLNFICYNGGTCNGESENAECACVDGYTGDNCEIFSKSKCEEKDKKCAETNGQCKSTAQGVICECPEGTSYLSSDGCKNRCENVVCYNEGKCTQENGVAKCRCTGGFTGKKCEKFPKDKCKEKMEKCAETNGTCMSEDEDKVNCTCKTGFIFVNEEGCKKIEDINCKEICGDNPEVVCGGNKKDKKTIKCSCKNTTKDFDEGAKECKINYCKVKCKDAKCDGNKFEEDEVKCSCLKPDEDFDDEAKKCKINYCKRKCGTADCEAEDHYKNVDIKCSCNDGDYIFKDKKCIKKCSENSDCNNEGTCEGKEGEKVCKCKQGTFGDLCEKIEACEEGKKYGKCRDGKGDCKFKGGKAVCECTEENHVLYGDGGYCDVQCENDESCDGNRICNKAKFCVCKKGWEGDDCDVVTGCKTLNKECEDIGKQCVFDENVSDLLATCNCGDNLKYYRKKKQCLPQCGTNKKCGDKRVCNNDNFCECKVGYEGEDCSIVTGCKDLRKKCEEIKVDCIFDDESSVKATCNCTKGFKYDPKDNQCKHEFCYPVNPCKKPANCTFDESTEVGFCKCPENQFYSYEAEECKEFDDKCLLRKTSCGKNEACNKKTGKCECKGKKEGEECKWNFCDSKPCFQGANCTENGICFCAEGKYYKNKACKAASCNIKNYKTACTCPVGKREKEGTECVIPDNEKCENKTEKDCGYGLCKKVNKRDSCKCFGFAENKAFNETCTLKKEYCASGQLQENDPMKCKCDGKYKQADDGITCTLKTCDDDGVKEECESLGGKCVMNWKADGYYCECPEGYEKDNNGKCSDPCSVEKNFKPCTGKGQVCYNSFSTSNKITTTCNCPPTVKLVNGKCEEKAANAYLFKNIPVLKEKYELKSGINKVLLNKHLVQSLQQTFKKDLYEFGYLFDYNVQGDIVNCSVWVNFKTAPTDKDLKKIKAASKTFSKVCDDCDDSAMIWPPNLFLSSTGLKKAEPYQQDFCKVKDRLCGKGAKCTEDKNKNGKCTCAEGYQVVQYGILKIGPHEVQVCEDINECALGTHKCPKNTECFNTIGDYSCVCKEGFKKENPPADPETDKSACVDLCTPDPCKKGKCIVKEKEKTFDCECEPGAAGSYCQRADEHYKSAKKSTVVVGAVLGTILIVGAIAVIYFIIKKKKRFGSEDFMPTPRMDHAEMTERRHVRGVTNRGYE